MELIDYLQERRLTLLELIEEYDGEAKAQFKGGLYEINILIDKIKDEATNNGKED